MKNRQMNGGSVGRALFSVALGSFLLLAISLTIVQAQATFPTEDGVLRQRGITLIGKYDIVVKGAGLAASPSNSVTLNAPGTIIAAYLYWSGIRESGGTDDPNVFLEVDGATAVPVTALTVYGPSDWYPNYVHNTYVADVKSLVASGSHTYTFSGYTVGAGAGSETYGFSLLVVYEDTSLSSTKITLLDGLDSVYNGFGSPRDGLSAVNCITFDPGTAIRALDAAFIASGVSDPTEGYRPNNLYFFTGSGTPPSVGGDLTGLPGVVVVADPFSSADGPQIDTFETEFTVPAGAIYACFQAESKDVVVAVPPPTNTVTYDGASFVWQMGAFSLREEAPNAVNLQSLTAVPPFTYLLFSGFATLLLLVPTAVVMRSRRRQK